MPLGACQKLRRISKGIYLCPKLQRTPSNHIFTCMVNTQLKITKKIQGENRHEQSRYRLQL